MAKSVNPCLFCTEEEPCAAHAPKPTKTSTRKQAVSKPTVIEPLQTPSGESPTSDDWFSSAKINRFESRIAEADAAANDNEVLRERQMLLNLEPIMCDDDKRKYKDLMYPPRDARLVRMAAEVRKNLEARE